MPITKTVTSLAVLALLASAIAPTRAIGGNPKAHRSSSVLLGNGMHVDLSRTPSPLATSLVFSGADSLRGSRHILRQELQGIADDDPRGRPDTDEGGPARRMALEVAAEGLFDVFGFEVGASASFDPLCEFINPLLPVDDQLECGQGVDEVEEPAPIDDEYGEYDAQVPALDA